MRKTFFILSVLSIFILIANSADVTNTSELNAKIKRIKSYLEKPGGPGSDGDILHTLHPESILQAAPETGSPPEFTETMKETKEATDPKSMLNPDGFVYMNKAYRLINAGHDFRMPDSILGIQDAINYARMVLASARESLKVGRIDIDACVKNPIYVVLMIMTPTHQ